MLSTCEHCGNPFIMIEHDLSGDWYNCYKCGWEKPVEGIPEEIIDKSRPRLKKRKRPVFIESQPAKL